MFIVTRRLRIVSYFICCTVLLFASCSKQALEQPSPTEPFPTNPQYPYPPFQLTNVWSKLSTPGIPPNQTPTYSYFFVVNDKLYGNGDGVLYAYDAVTKTWAKIDYSMEFQYGMYLFSHQSKAYFLKWHKFLRTYDMDTHTWSDKADYPGTDTYAGAYTATATKGYVMGGQSGADAQGMVLLQAENWEYNFASDTWTKKANTPGAPRYGAKSVAVGDKIYYGAGAMYISKVQLNPFKIYQEPLLFKDWWEYNTMTNTWTQKADFGGGARVRPEGFVLNGKVYAGAGYQDGDQQNYLTDLWRYDPASNTWLKRKDCPIVPDQGNPIHYAATSNGGYGINEDFNECWQYHP